MNDSEKLTPETYDPGYRGTMFSVWGISYNDALSLIEDLAKYRICANITAGGIAICPDGTIQHDKMKLVCEKYNTIPTRGFTPHEERIMYCKKSPIPL